MIGANDRNGDTTQNRIRDEEDEEEQGKGDDTLMTAIRLNQQ
jgi:hypothetical protein